MIHSKKLNLNDKLPLTCARTGTCCHGKIVNLNPWELAQLANTKKLSPREFRDRYCDFGGIRLSFNGSPDWKGLPACSQYIPDSGCSVHLGRPLACRLYPLGHQKQGGKDQYIYQGKEFPCLEGCPEVVNLPQLTILEYIKEQKTEIFEIAQNEYLELMQNIANVAFTLLLETNLAKEDINKVLDIWGKIGLESPEEMKILLRDIWIDLLMLPKLSNYLDDPIVFASEHYKLIQIEIQKICNNLDSTITISDTSELLMRLALYLGCGLGINHKDLSEHWIKIAKQDGALF